jgi:hypothetical protein
MMTNPFTVDAAPPSIGASSGGQLLVSRYFRALSIPTRGRDFSLSDRSDSTRSDRQQDARPSLFPQGDALGIGSARYTETRRPVAHHRGHRR